MTQRVLITAALPYANGPLHFGHIAGAYLPSDVYARFLRLKGDEVLFICGSDEYGVAITISAEKEGRTPKEHVDLFHAVNKAFFDMLAISFDHYSRTTNPFHAPLAQQFFSELYKGGHIEAHTTEQLYSPKEKRFLADRYVVGTCPKCGYTQARGDECPECGHSHEAIELKNPQSKVSGDTLIKKPTRHWFLRYDHFKEQLSDWIAKKPWKANVIHFAKNYIDDLKMRAVTRDGQWGVEVPLDGAEGKVLYVWFDAPIGYLSATQEYAALKKDPEIFEKFWCDPTTKLIQFVGKDNIPFHAVFFPAMIMGQKTVYKLVDELPANEFYRLEGKQFSKSEGWYIDLDNFFKKYQVDQIRYMIAASAPETQDAEFTWKEFQMRCNAELLGKFGNLINRVFVFTHQNLGGQVPSKAHLQEEDRAFLGKIHDELSKAYRAYEGFSLRKAAAAFMEMCQLTNVYFDHEKPWALKKDPVLQSRLDSVIYGCLEALRLIALVCNPLIPNASRDLLEMLGFKSISPNWKGFVESPFKGNEKLAQPKVLFKKIEDSEIAEEIQKLHTLSKPQQERAKVDIDDFKKLHIVVGQILEAEKVEGSSKLYRLRVDDGQRQRQVVAGLAEVIDQSLLIGKQVLVLANLEKAVIRGIESDGMVLALKEGKHLKPLLFDGFKLGAELS